MREAQGWFAKAQKPGVLPRLEQPQAGAEGDFDEDLDDWQLRRVFAAEYRHTENLTITHSTCIIAKFPSGPSSQ
jgi:hypothetical protein